MHVTSKGRILVVDDQPEIRELMVRLLTTRGGYEVRTAEDGFDALLQLKAMQPDVIIADLNMPRMSGFELLSVVRRRFPEIPVVAMSGAYDSGDHVPGGVIADAFYAKGSHLEMLISIVAELIQTSAERSVSYRQKSAPVWIPRNLNGVPFITECLRSFPMSAVKRL